MISSGEKDGNPRWNQLYCNPRAIYRFAAVHGGDTDLSNPTNQPNHNLSQYVGAAVRADGGESTE